jgi:hypothetical protein
MNYITYSAAFGIIIFMTGMTMSPSIPPIYRSLLTVPSAAIAMILACHAFRVIGLGFINDDVSPYSRLTTVPHVAQNPNLA